MLQGDVEGIFHFHSNVSSQILSVLFASNLDTANSYSNHKIPSFIVSLRDIISEHNACNIKSVSANTELSCLQAVSLYCLNIQHINGGKLFFFSNQRVHCEFPLLFCPYLSTDFPLQNCNLSFCREQVTNMIQD